MHATQFVQFQCPVNRTGLRVMAHLIQRRYIVKTGRIGRIDGLFTAHKPN